MKRTIAAALCLMVATFAGAQSAPGAASQAMNTTAEDFQRGLSITNKHGAMTAQRRGNSMRISFTSPGAGRPLEVTIRNGEMVISTDRSRTSYIESHGQFVFDAGFGETFRTAMTGSRPAFDPSSRSVAYSAATYNVLRQDGRDPQAAAFVAFLKEAGLAEACQATILSPGAKSSGAGCPLYVVGAILGVIGSGVVFAPVTPIGVAGDVTGVCLIAVAGTLGLTAEALESGMDLLDMWDKEEER